MFLESGETMKAAGLMPIDTILSTSAVLIKSKHPSHPELIDKINSRIRGVIGSVFPLPIPTPESSNELYL